MKKRTIKLLDEVNFKEVFRKLMIASENIDMAVMFIKNSGLQLIKGDLIAALRSGSKIRILLGVDFQLTDPAVLSDLHKLTTQYSNLRVRIYLPERNITFHPKVYIFSKQNDASIIMGSSNLSKSGFTANIEANALIHNKLLANDLGRYFDALFTLDIKGGNSIDLTADFAGEYQKIRKKHRVDNTATSRAREKIMAYARRMTRIKIQNMHKMLKEASIFLKDKEFLAERVKRRGLIKYWRRSLDIPMFTEITKAGWFKLYKEGAIGGLNSVWRDRLWRKKKMLVRSLRFSCDEKIPINIRIDDILTGTKQLHGFKIGTITKILAIYKPNKYGVWNNQAAKFLKQYSAEFTAGGSIGKKYVAWLSFLKKIKEVGYNNLVEVDYFVWRYSFD